MVGVVETIVGNNSTWISIDGEWNARATLRREGAWTNLHLGALHERVFNLEIQA